MTILNEARFTINGTPSEDALGNRWFIGSHSQTLTLTLENNPSSALSVTYQVYSSADPGSPYASKNAPELLFVENGLYQITPDVPNDSVSIVLPGSGVVTYTIRASAVLARGVVDVYERMVAIRTTVTSPPLRKTVPAETSEFEIRGFSDTIDDIIDAIQSGGGAGCTLDAAYDYGGPGFGRFITADSGSVRITVPDNSGNVGLELLYNDVTHHTHALKISQNTSGAAIYLAGTVGAYETIWSDEHLLLGADLNLLLTDQNRADSTWSSNGIQLSSSDAEWTAIETLIGYEGSIFSAILAAAAGGGGGNLDYAYHYGGAGTGRSITADEGAVTITVPYDDNNSALYLIAEWSGPPPATNLNPVLTIEKQTLVGGPVWNDSHSIFMTGVSGQSVWSDKSLYVGASNTVTAAQCSYSLYDSNFTGIYAREDDGTNGASVELQSGIGGYAKLDAPTVKFTDGYCNWTSANLVLSDSAADWTALETYIGFEGSLLNALIATLDRAYDGGGTGLGKSVTVDAGAVSFTVPAAGTSASLSLSNLEATNTSEVLNIYNQGAVGSKAIYLDGNAGGGTTVDVMGHLIWTGGSVTIGHETGSGETARRSFTTYQYDNPGAFDSARAIMEASCYTAYSLYSRVDCLAGGSTAQSCHIDVDSVGGVTIHGGMGVSITTGGTNAIHLHSGGEINFQDSYISGWANSIPLADSAQEYEDLALLIGDGVTPSYGSIIAGILAAAVGSGAVAEPQGQIVYGTGTGVDSETGLYWDTTNDRLRITHDVSKTNWYDSGAAALYLTGTATQGQVIGSDQSMVVGVYGTDATDRTLRVLNTQTGATSASPLIEVLATAVTLAEADYVSASIGTHYGGDSSGYDASVLCSNQFTKSYVELTASFDANECSIELARTSTAGTLTLASIGTVDFGSAKLTNILNASYGSSPTTVTYGASISVNWATGKPIQKVTITNNVTSVSFTAPNGVTGGLCLIVYNSGASSYTVDDFPAGVIWPDGDPTPVTITAGSTHVFTFLYQGSSSYLGSYL